MWLAGAFFVLMWILASIGVLTSPKYTRGPVPIAHGYPAYPAAAAAAGLEGTATIECTVTRTGATRDCVVKAATDPAFGASALRFERTALYAPARWHGLPVATPHHQATVTFQLPPRIARSWFAVRCGVDAAGMVRDCRPSTGAPSAAMAIALKLLQQVQAQPTRHAGQAIDDPDRWFSVAIALSSFPLHVPPVSLPGDLSMSFTLACLPGAPGLPPSCGQASASEPAPPGATRFRVDLAFSGIAAPRDPGISDARPVALPGQAGQDTEPLALNPGRPNVPETVARDHLAGTVTADCTITDAGISRDCTILHGVDPRLDAAVLDFVRAERYWPATHDGVPITIRHHPYTLDLSTAATGSPLLARWSCAIDPSGGVTACTGSQAATSPVWEPIIQVVRSARILPRPWNGRTIVDRRRTLLISIDGSGRPAFQDDSIVIRSCDRLPGQEPGEPDCQIVATQFVPRPTEQPARTIAVTIAGLRAPVPGDRSQSDSQGEP